MPTAPGVGTENVRLTANTTVIANTTINSLVLVGNVILTINSGVTLTVGSGGLIATGGTVTVTGGGTLALGEAVITTNAGSTVNINTPLSGTNLTLAGGGTVNLPSANNFSGTTTLAGPTLNLGVSTALGAGGFTLIAGTLQTSSASGLLLSKALTFNNSVITLAGTNPLVFSGIATLGGTNNTLTVTNTAQTDFSGVISGAGNLTTAGTGTLTLSGANTYTGLTNITAGFVLLENNTALGSATGGAATVASGASVQTLGSGLNIAKAIVLNGNVITGNGALENLVGGNNTWSGAITLASATSLGADAGTTLTITGVIGGTGNLTKVGAGTLVLNAANTYTGQTNINNGVVNVQNGLGLGLVTGAVVVNSGATLQVQGGITVPGKNITLNGTGFGNSGVLPQGALVNQTGTNTWTGNIVLTGTVALTGGNVPLLASTSTGTLIGAAAGTLNVTGVVSGTDLTKVGNGAVQLLNINTYTGATTVLGGNLTLANNNNTAVGRRPPSPVRRSTVSRAL